MKYLKRFNENKMWYKSIPEILNWIEIKSRINWILIDTETTGLRGPKNEQLTQSKIGPALNIDMNGYHDALTDCKLMINMLIKIIEILKDNKEVDISKYQNIRIKSIKS